MTKEEQLKQEAEEYANNKVPKTLLPNLWERYFNSYLAGAEPREKRIEVLEKEVEQLREHNLYMFDTIALKSQQIEKLEKENEMLKGDLELWESGGCRATNLFECGVVKELKEQIEKMKCCYNCFYDCEDCNSKNKDCDKCPCGTCVKHNHWELRYYRNRLLCTECAKAEKERESIDED